MSDESVQLSTYYIFAAFKQEQKEKRESQAVRKKKKGTANAPPPSTSSSQQQPMIHSEPSSGTVNLTKQPLSAESASSSQGEEDVSMEVDPVICAQQTNHSPAHLSVNSNT